MTERKNPGTLDYRERLGCLQSILMAAPALVLLWALAKGYGPLLFIWAAGLWLVGISLRLAFLLWQLWRL